jgi:hypothetical protein
MIKLKLTLLSLLLFNKPKPVYYIIVGDITCKACVIQLHMYYSKKVKSLALLIGIEDKNNLLLNGMKENYFRQELPKANFVFLNNTAIFNKTEKYPFILKIAGKDTLKLPYDSVFIGEYLNARNLK